MKTSQHACITLFMGLLPLALGQGSLTTTSLAPSPTQSVGCEPHGDHWHCDGPRVTSITATPSTLLTSVTAPPSAVTSSPAHHDHDDDHDHDHDNDDEDDEDHDHDHDHDHDDDDNVTWTTESRTVTIKPSPTESVGCVAHGDHWHCDGPATASPTQSAPATSGVPSGVTTVGNSGGSHSGVALLSVLGTALLGAALVL